MTVATMRPHFMPQLLDELHLLLVVVLLLPCAYIRSKHAWCLAVGDPQQC